MVFNVKAIVSGFFCSIFLFYSVITILQSMYNMYLCLFPISFVPVFTVLFVCFARQDVSQVDIPIMLVGNKCDLRKDGGSCVPTSYGEKLAMVKTHSSHCARHFNDHITHNTFYIPTPTSHPSLIQI